MTRDGTDERSGGGFSEPGSSTAAAPAPGDAAGPRYTVGALLGRGGMGEVRAARDEVLGRDVALKTVAAERVGDAAAEARLAREAAVTSRLDHPGIVAVHDAGLLPDGRRFYTMRLVRGRTLARAIAEASTPGERRQLVRHVLAAAEAVAAAHDAGIVHRDLKPENVLIGPHGETQVTDWGLATPTLEAADRWGRLPGEPTLGGGTAAYVAPEQARGEAPDPRHDVWSLGVVLARVSGPDAPAELAAISARATSSSSGQRYPDAAAFADDLLRWFEGRRVAAHAYTAGELLRRLLVAYRLPVVVGAAGALAAGLAAAVGYWRTSAALDRALLAEEAAQAALADLRRDEAVAATRAGDRETAERYAIAVLRTRQDPVARGVLAAFGRAERPAVLADAAGPDCAWATFSEDGSWLLCGQADRVSRWEGGRASWEVAIEAAGAQVRRDRVLVWDRADGTVALDASTGAEVGRWPLGSGDWAPLRPPRRVGDTEGLPPSGCATSMQVAATGPDGRVAALCADGTLVLAADGEVRARVRTEAFGDHVATDLAWTADGRLAVGTLRGRALLLSGDDGALLSSVATDLGSIGAVRVAPDGRHAALSGTTGGVGLWRLDDGALLAEVPAGEQRAVAFSEGGLVVWDGRLRTWRVPAGAPAMFRGSGGLADVAGSGDGSRIALAGGDGAVFTVDLRDGRARRAPLGDRVVKSVCIGPDGSVVATGMAEPYLGVGSEGGWSVLASPRPLRRLACLPGGEIVGADLHAGLYAWGERTAPPRILEGGRAFTDLERDGDTLVLLDAGGAVERLADGGLSLLATEPAARAVAARGERLAIAAADAVIVRDSAGERRLDGGGGALLDVALSPDGASVAAGGLDGDVRVWDAATGALLGRLPGHTERVVAVEFLPDGDLVSASWDGTARVWDLDALRRPVEDLQREIEAAWGAEP